MSTLVVPEPLGWTTMYCETPEESHNGCWTVAQRFLANMKLPAKMPEGRSKVSLQVAADYGFWTLRHLEEEARRKRGEGRWTVRYDLDCRASVFQPTLASFKAAALAEAATPAGHRPEYCPDSSSPARGVSKHAQARNAFSSLLLFFC